MLEEKCDPHLDGKGGGFDDNLRGVHPSRGGDGGDESLLGVCVVGVDAAEQGSIIMIWEKERRDIK